MSVTPYFSGLSDVVCGLGNINGFMLTNKGTTYTAATFVTESVHHLAIASATTADRTSMIFPVNEWENTTDDVAIETSGLGKKVASSKPIPSGIFYLDVSNCDYQTLKDLECQKYDIVLFTDEGKQIGTKNSSGLRKGFRAKLAFKYGLPIAGSVQKNYPVYVFFEHADEFRDMVVVSPDYKYSDLVDFVPVGLNVEITTAYVAGTFTTVMKVTKRSTGLGETGCVAADFEILESDADPAPAQVTSIVDNGLGSYDVLIKDSTPTTPLALSSGQYYRLQVSKDDATYVTYVSNVIKETVA